jgi:hypothetical protein
MPRVRNPKDFVAGLIFFGLGIAVTVYGARYSIGTASHMGPGYFPRMLGVGLILLGAVIALRALGGADDKFERFRLRPLIALLALGCFGLVVEQTGLLLGVLGVVVFASAASTEFRFRESLISAVVLAGFSSLIFVYGIGVQLPILPPVLE